MRAATRDLWREQNRHPGDRRRLFDAVATVLTPERVLYPGSYVDVAASFVFPSVTYVDVDDRAARFFADAAGVAEVIASEDPAVADPQVRFVHADYSSPLDLPDASFDLLVSLYAGPVSEHCTRYLRKGGTLLVNPSHGDASLAAVDDRYALTGVVTSRSGVYRVRRDGLADHLIPKQGDPPTREEILKRGRGVAYTKPAFAYLFDRVR